jgi:predicted RNA-binding Zn-ribbon protein involved in translation (DUF1610 family)
MATICLKCDYERQPADSAPDYECPQCGVVYAKAKAAIQREAQKSSTNGDGKTGRSTDGPELSQSDIAVLKTKLKREQTEEKRIQEQELVEERKRYETAFETTPVVMTAASDYKIAPPFLASLFNLFAILGLISGIVLCVKFWPGDPPLGKEWKTLAYMPSFTWLSIGIVEAAFFAAIAQTLIYLKGIFENGLRA